MTTTVSELVNALRRSGLQESAAAASALEAGWVLDRISTASIDEGLVQTYRIRAQHLSQMRSDHAARLLTSTLEFVENLEQSKSTSISLLSIKGSEQHYYVV